MTPSVVVIAIGNPFRSDDGVALRVLDELRRLEPALRLVEHDGEPSGLIDLWDGDDLAIVVDACRSGAPAGTIHTLDPTRDELPVSGGAVSGHGVGLAEAVRLAQVLDRLPRRLRVVAVDIEHVRPGTELSPAVAAAVPAMARAVLTLLP